MLISKIIWNTILMTAPFFIALGVTVGFYLGGV